jgi:predicted DNA-binding antitoxin AbrB/MazE fold protein
MREGDETMTRNVQAIYEKGVLRPLEPLNLREHELVTVAVTDQGPAEPWLDAECLDAAAGEADDAVTLDEVRAALAKIPGSLTGDFIAEREDR